MDKDYAEFLLEEIKFLSAIESWSFATKERMPDYLLERLDGIRERMEKELLNGIQGLR